jgi:S1-C subfamily serine protease
VPAVQLFSGPNPDYHRSTDTADKIDPEGLVKIAAAAREAVSYLAGREGPLTALSSGGSSVTPRSGPRTVSLGTIPDFAYRGRGYRLSGVVPGSPAEAAGLREGDVIVRVNTKAVDGLKAFSDILKNLNPDDEVSIVFAREGRELTVTTRVVAK